MVETAKETNTQTSVKSEEKFDVEGYFKRIGFSGERSATLETLKQIHKFHPQAIPFENLNPFLRIPVSLDIHDLYRKLVLSKRGGYCFEHNLLLMEVLRALGFKVKGLAARVLWNQPQGAITARGHMLLLVSIGSVDYITDVGFGGMTLTAPLQLKVDEQQQTPHEDFKITPLGSDYVLQAKVQGDWRMIYSFSLQENFQIDYEVTSWYLSNFPSSHFITGVIAALAFDGGRYALRNTDFSVHYLDGRHERKSVQSVDTLIELLTNTFRIDVPVTPDADKLFAQIVQNGAKK